MAPMRHLYSSSMRSCALITLMALMVQSLDRNQHIFRFARRNLRAEPQSMQSGFPAHSNSIRQFAPGMYDLYDGLVERSEREQHIAATKAKAKADAAQKRKADELEAEIEASVLEAETASDVAIDMDATAPSVAKGVHEEPGRLDDALIGSGGGTISSPQQTDQNIGGSNTAGIKEASNDAGSNTVFVGDPSKTGSEESKSTVQETFQGSSVQEKSKWGDDPRHIVIDNLQKHLVATTASEDGVRVQKSHKVGNQLADSVEDLIEEGAKDESEAELEGERMGTMDDVQMMIDTVQNSEEAEPEGDGILKQTVQATVEAAMELGGAEPLVLGNGDDLESVKDSRGVSGAVTGVDVRGGTQNDAKSEEDQIEVELEEQDGYAVSVAESKASTATPETNAGQIASSNAKALAKEGNTTVEELGLQAEVEDEEEEDLGEAEEARADKSAAHKAFEDAAESLESQVEKTEATAEVIEEELSDEQKEDYFAAQGEGDKYFLNTMRDLDVEAQDHMGELTQITLKAKDAVEDAGTSAATDLDDAMGDVSDLSVPVLDSAMGDVSDTSAPEVSSYELDSPDASELEHISNSSLDTMQISLEKELSIDGV